MKARFLSRARGWPGVRALGIAVLAMGLVGCNGKHKGGNGIDWAAIQAQLRGGGGGGGGGGTGGNGGGNGNGNGNGNGDGSHTDFAFLDRHHASESFDRPANGDRFSLVSPAPDPEISIREYSRRTDPISIDELGSAYDRSGFGRGNNGQSL